MDKDSSESTLRKDVDSSLSTSMPQVEQVRIRSRVTILDSGEIAGIRNAEQGKKFLDETQYLVPSGDPATLDGLAAALFTTIPNLQKAKPTKNAIKCVEAVTHILCNLQRPINEERIAELFNVIEQLFNNYFSFCPCLLLFGFVDDIIKCQQHESDFISFYLCLSLFGYLLSPISYLLISGSYPIGGYLDHILLVDKSWLV